MRKMKMGLRLPLELLVSVVIHFSFCGCSMQCDSCCGRSDLWAMHLIVPVIHLMVSWSL